MSVQSQIDRITGEVASQTTLISDIIGALKGQTYQGCTVVFNGSCKLYNIAYTEVSGSELVAKTVYAAGVTSYTLHNVAAQSLLCVGINGSTAVTVSGGADLGVLFSTSRAIRINATPGSTVTITIAA